MISNKKKGQVTIFVILGLVLLIGAFFTLYLTRSGDDVEFDMSDVTGRVTSYVAQCSDSIVEDYIPRALITGGYGEFPFNTVRTEQNAYVLSFSSEGVPYGIYEANFADDLLYFELMEIDTCIEPLLESDVEIHNEEIEIQDFYYLVELEEHSIIVNYTIVFELRGNTYNNSITRSYRTNLGYFLNKANEITDFVLEERETNNFFNYQFCRSMVEEEGFAPKYSADFLTEFEVQGASLLFDRDFYVIFLERGEETFPFAIMPYHDGYFC